MSRAGPDHLQQQQPTDDELLDGIRRGSEADFNVLYERYFRRVYTFAYLRLRSHADTEEVVQDTFSAVFRSIDAYRGQSALLSWIFGIAKNLVNNHLRRAKAYDLRLEKAEAEFTRPSSALGACTPEEQLNLHRCAEAMNDRLAGVAEWQAEVFRLRHVEDMTIGTIADRVSRSNDAVRSSLYRVKRLLVEAVESGLGAAGDSSAERGRL